MDPWHRCLWTHYKGWVFTFWFRSKQDGPSMYLWGLWYFHGTINNFPVTLNRVLYSKDVNKNLISGIKLASEGILFSTRNKDNKTFVKLSPSKNNSILGYFNNQDNIIRIPILQGSNILSNLEDDNNSDLQLWHNRLGHFYNKDIFIYLSDHKYTWQNQQGQISHS